MEDEFAELAGMLGYSENDLKHELIELVRARVSFLVRAAKFANDSQVERYLADLLGRSPDVEEISLSRRARRRYRLSDDERMQLEGIQCGRCGLCGRFFEFAGSVHVDHIVPLAQGGEDALANLQLLCRDCNLGKHDLSNWLLGVPYQSEQRTPRLRYCVLSRAKGRCSVPHCEAGPTNSELELVTRVPPARGGRWVFDNLAVMCAEHARKTISERTQMTKRALTQKRGAILRKLTS